MAIGCGGKDTQSSGPSPGALFRRAIKFGSDTGRPVPVVDNDDNDDITDLQAQTPPRLPSLNDTAILNFQFDPTQPVSSNVCNSMIDRSTDNCTAVHLILYDCTTVRLYTCYPMNMRLRFGSMQ